MEAETRTTCKLLNQKEVASLLNVHPTTVAKLLEQELIPKPIIKGIGRRKQWSEAQIVEWIRDSGR